MPYQVIPKLKNPLEYMIMAKNYYAVIYEDGRSKIFIKLQEFKEAIDNYETRYHRGRLAET